MRQGHTNIRINDKIEVIAGKDKEIGRASCRERV